MRRSYIDCRHDHRTRDCPDSWAVCAKDYRLAAGAEPHAKMPSFSARAFAMDIERINQIGNTLADLSTRTEALRRYL